MPQDGKPSQVSAYIHMIQDFVNELGNDGKTLTLTEHMMARFIVDAWENDGIVLLVVSVM